MAVGTRLRLGLVGAGRRGQAHLLSIAGMPDLFELVAVCDATQANLHAAVERADVNAYTDARALFSHERLDVVAIVTPPDSHHVFAGLAAEYGVHMLIETPLAPTRAMMDYIEDVAARAGVKVEVAENSWRHPVQRLNRVAVEAGLIGKLLRTTCFYEMGGNVGMSYHAMNVLRYSAGASAADAEVRAFEVRSQVDMSLDDSGRPINPEIWNQALLSFANGVVGSNTQLSTWSSPLRRSHPRSITIEGSAGLIVSGRRVDGALYRLEDETEATYPLKVDTRRSGDREVPVRYRYETSPLAEFTNPFADWPLPYGESSFGLDDDIARAHEWASIHRAVATGAAVEYAIADARQDQELSIAVNESARLGGLPVRLPLAGETAWEQEQHEAFRSKWEADPFTNASQLAARNFGARGFP